MHKRPISKKALNTEDCLEIVAGISELKYSADRFKSTELPLHEDNANICLVSQTSIPGTAPTAKQYSSEEIASRILCRSIQFLKLILHEAVEKLRSSLRKIYGSLIQDPKK